MASYGQRLRIAATLAIVAAAGAEFSARPAARRVRGGFKPAEDVPNEVLQSTYTLSEATTAALATVSSGVDDLRKSLDAGEAVQGMGARCQKIVDGALEKFDKLVSKRVERGLLAKSRAGLQAQVYAQLHPLFLQQLQLVKLGALQMYQESMAMSDVNVQGMLAADQYFVREASASVPSGADWGFQGERQNLQTIMQTLEREWKKGVAAKIQAAQQMSTAMQYLQVQQAQLQQLQQQLYGGGAGKWQLGAAYRPPDTNINLSFNHQQGRTNIVASMVPDEQQSLLGPNGFTAGVGPANLGVTLNLNV